MSCRLDRDELLLHPARRLLFESVCARPGIPFLECLAVLRSDAGLAPGAGHGMLMHHLRLLERFHFVTSCKEGRYRRYFQNGGRFGRAVDQIALLQTPPVPLIAQVLLDEPGITQKELTRRVGEAFSCTRQTMAYHLKRLEAKGLLLRVEEGSHARYYPLQALATTIQFAAQATEQPPLTKCGTVVHSGAPVAAPPLTSTPNS